MVELVEKRKAAIDRTMEINRIIKSAVTDEDAGKFAEKENALLKKKDEISSRIHESEMRLTTVKEELAIAIQQRDRAFQSIKDSAQNKHVFELSTGLSQMMGTMLESKSESIKCNLEKLIVQNLQHIYRKNNLITHIEVEDDFQFNLYQNVEYTSTELLHLIKNLGKEVFALEIGKQGMKLLCENNRSQVTKELLTQLEKVNRYTEQALYYARSEHTEKDYSVREIRLFDVVHQSIAENKYLLLQNGVGIDLQETDDTVYSDEKWLCFILNQMIVNSVKYRTERPVLQFYIERQGNQVILCVEDNGIGIDAGDLQRIFEKGFTGQNGRKVLQNSTGIGLYLCRRLCNKLGIGICADSKGSGTTLRLIFHINDFIERV